ncbi:MAG: serine/threonine-protein phosphatase [Acidobacteria bacterium]|nr:MAG: serine/threonine-protein phosphatase [Acidobacteriota bacterium]
METPAIRIANMLQSRRGISFNAAGTNPGSQAVSGTSMFELEFAQLSDPGKVREHNEDFIGYAEPRTPEQVRSHGWLFALADGCGGHDRGEIASRMAVDTLVSSFYADRGAEATRNTLQRLVQSANSKICACAATASPGSTTLATTLVACALRQDRATVAHVGDSRCYLTRRGRASLLTQDHTVVHEQVKLGLLSEEEAAASETRHYLSRSLGSNLVLNADIDEHQLLPGDVLLLSSDGLHGSVSAEEIASLISRFPDLGEAARTLVSLACERDGSDNISVQLIRIKVIERVGVYRGRPYNLR